MATYSVSQEVQLTPAEYTFADRYSTQYRHALLQGIPNVLHLIDSVFSKYQDAVPRLQALDPTDFPSYLKWRFEECGHIRSVLHATANKKMRDEYNRRTDKKDNQASSPETKGTMSGPFPLPPRTEKKSTNPLGKPVESVDRVLSTTQMIRNAGLLARKNARPATTRTPPSRPPTIHEPRLETTDDQSTPAPPPPPPPPSSSSTESSQATSAVPSHRQRIVSEERYITATGRPKRMVTVIPSLKPRPPPSLLLSTPPRRLPLPKDYETEDMDALLEMGQEHFQEMDSWTHSLKDTFPPRRGSSPFPPTQHATSPVSMLPSGGPSPATAPTKTPVETPVARAARPRVDQLQGKTGPRRSPRIQNLSPTPLSLPATKRRARRQVFKLSTYTLTTDEEDNLELPPPETLLAVGPINPPKVAARRKRLPTKEHDGEAFSHVEVKRRRL